MARRKQNELVQCEFCGEMYSVTYKHCPFCNEDGTGGWDAEPDEQVFIDDSPAADDGSPKGGKRLAGGSGGNGPSVRGIIAGILSLALILSAAGIVYSILRSMLGERKVPTAATSAAPVTSVAPVESKAPEASAAPVESSAPAESTAPVESQAAEPIVETAAPVVSAAPAVQSPQPQVVTAVGNVVAPTGFTLSKEDFTFSHAGEIYDMKVRFTPANATADVTWKSSNPNVASVSWNGRVTAVSQGTVTLTATVAGVGEKTCICRCNFTDSSAASTSASSGSSTTTVSTPAPSGSTTTTVTPGLLAPATTSAPASSLKLNRSDFTLSHAGETFRMALTGSSSKVSWASSNTGVATIGADGLVTAVAPGTCKVYGTVDGQTLECIVRCSF